MRYVTAQIVVISGFFLLLLSACNNDATPTASFNVTPAPGLPKFDIPTIAPGAYPIPASSASKGSASRDGRGQSAVSSLKSAQAIALSKFSSDAQLYAIVPSTIMIGNLGGLPVLPGWFFKFKVAGSRREFYVQVIDGAINGTTLAESMADTKPEELPIDVFSLKLDSPQVFDQFLKIAAQRGIKIEGIVYDLELINPKGGSGPVWSIVDPITLTWLYSLNAVTGAEVSDPHK
jgi:hypothetical protein